MAFYIKKTYLIIKGFGLTTCDLNRNIFTGLSLPTDLELFSGDDDLMYQMQNLEVENAMLRNELNVINREVSELTTKLRMAQDGNNVDSQGR